MKLFFLCPLLSFVSLVVVFAQDNSLPLMDLAALPNPPLLDVRYATQYNFTGAKLYSAPVAWLRPEAAKALQTAGEILKKQGFGIRVLDAYRPLSVQQKMWDLIRDERYVSDPAVNQGRHTRGTAVDVTLADLMGNPLPMPSGFDDFSEKAHRDFSGASPEELRNKKILEEAMLAAGFEAFPTEWWHYDLRGWREYPALDISIDALLSAGKPPLPSPKNKEKK